MSDCILCGEASGGSEYAICGECCEANAASERELLKTCADCWYNCDCTAVYVGERCPCCAGFEPTYLISEKRKGAALIALLVLALLSFAAGVACGWLLL